MIFKLLKSTAVKLLLLVCTALSTLILSSFLFNSQIDGLKKQIDILYFGNLIPIVKLQIIADKYKEIESCKKIKINCNFKEEEQIIFQEWSYYISSYKNAEEKIVVDTINEEIINSFKENKLQNFKNILKRIDFLIKYETQVAFKERKNFLEDYEKMKSYLFFNMLLILLISFSIIVYIIFQVIKKDRQLTVLNKKYKLDSITDSMTNLHNRKYFDTIFDNMPFISNANNWKCAFIMIDIDYFKQYNDTYGHDMGDEALKKVALTIKEYFNKKYEFTFRLGGEEFGVVLFDISKDILENCLKEMNKRVLELQIEHKNSKILPVLSISMGAIIYEPNSYISANKLYKQADECLYESKQNGRNQYHIYKG
ncbi:MAG: GGDEF domain-containing protein [Aliarcobacter sp.]|jgi:diguanylate cyclase (GGDEF)-like protein|nr:GGDEF domain-containing protein [Aliarcobacter sp.]MBP6712606.1 GGDEF domain-containing protein [Aliarcobacter sp.]MBP7226453.1 GGDEF domain-containing protein [Aliarcobacter sp.]MDX9961869.1 GGDEF domain-containing protein [Aliarcobacter sp.]